MLSAFFNFDTIAQTGQNGLTALGIPSINDSGQVAFVGQIATGQGVFTGNALAAATDLSPADAAAGTQFDSVSINNNDQVLARARPTNEPQLPSSSLRVYNGASGATVGQYTTIATGSTSLPAANFFGVAPNASMNNLVSSSTTASEFKHDIAFSGVSKDTLGIELGTPNGTNVQGASVFNTLPFPQGTSLDPQIADNGTIVVNNGSSSAPAILAYSAGLKTDVNISGMLSKTWVSLGSAPGISEDGSIIVFTGDLGQGPGVFVSIKNGTSFGTPFPIAGENGPATNGVSNGSRSDPELGTDAQGHNIYFQSIFMNSNVSVIHQATGKANTVSGGDSFIVAFIGTPNEASIANPVTGTPLLFSNQLGIWTERVNVAQPQVGAALQFHPTNALPVVQLDDILPNNGKANSLAIGYKLGEGTVSPDGAPRTPQPGDVQVAFWASTAAGQIEVRATHFGTDVILTGHVQWTLNGVNHPVPLAEVEIDEVTSQGPIVLTSISSPPRTNDNGDFTITVNVTPPTTGSLEIFDKVYANSPYAKVYAVSGGSNSFITPTTNTSLTAADFNQGFAKMPATTAADTTAGDTQAQIFSVDSALVQAGQYVNYLASGDPPVISVVVNGSVATGSSSSVYINVANGFDWDIIQHEYAHYVEGYYNFANVDEAKQHFFGQHTAGGVTEAFCEGWADFFPIAAQEKEKGQPYAANVPNVGDTTFTSTDPANKYSVNIASQIGVGEDDELSIAGVLYHLNAGDQAFTYSDQKMFQIFKSDHVTTIGGAWSALASPLTAEERAQLGFSFGKENIAPVEGTATINANVPTFTFTRNGAPGNYLLNDFVIQIYTKTSSGAFDYLGSLTVPASALDGNPATVTFTPTLAEWSPIISKNTSGLPVEWIVEGKNTAHDPQTPGGTVNRYWSEAQLLP